MKSFMNTVLLSTINSPDEDLQTSFFSIRYKRSLLAVIIETPNSFAKSSVVVLPVVEMYSKTLSRLLETNSLDERMYIPPYEIL